MQPYQHIAIDGGAGVGKSTIGERVARRLGYLYVDSGAFYRALTAVALARQIDPTDAAALTALAHDTNIDIDHPTAEQAADGRQYTVLANGVDITLQLRTPEVEGAVSRVSSHPAVRVALIALMRRMSVGRNVVMVGRDIGTVVLPEAHLKVFLTTSLHERARRRHGDLVRQLGERSPSFESVHAAMAQRDVRDAPNTFIAPEAHTINNDALEADDVVELILGLLKGSTA